MNRATRTTTSTLGAIAALAGLEHGIGEILQGSTAPAGRVIESWPNSAWFAILAGEPAFTLIPNLLVSGVVTICVTLLFLLWATRWVTHHSSGWVLLLLTLVLFLVGGGFGPPLLGILVGAAASQIHAPLAKRRGLPDGLRQLLAEAWPGILALCIAVWLLLFPGTLFLARIFTIDSLLFVPLLAFTAFGFSLLAIGAALAHDSLAQPQIDRLHRQPI